MKQSEWEDRKQRCYELSSNKEIERFTLITEHPHPLDSPDYYNPSGAVEDNNTHAYFIWEIDTMFTGMPYGLLDIGCAGGQFVVDVHSKGKPWRAAGVDGGNIYGMTEEFDEVFSGVTGDLVECRGRENWLNYENVCLFHADVSKPFQIRGEDGSKAKFDIVTSFEFFEHPLPEEIPGILKNINKHMFMGGMVVGTINLSPGEHHRCGDKNRAWWDSIFAEHGFVVPEDNRSIWTVMRPPEARVYYRGAYPFRTTYRTNQTLPPVLPFQPAEHYVSDNGTEFLFNLDESATNTSKNYAFCYIKAKDC
jgi:2-polyprenyl-3-methyl-5-hydroxy-6-metoxy-1,4-benzoquinol methylase